MTLNIEKRLAVAVITRNQTKVWAVRDASNFEPEVIERMPDDQRKNHYKQVSRNDHHGVERVDREYFEEIARLLRPASEILLVGHGHGKANEMRVFKGFVDDHFKDVATKVVDMVDTHVESMSDPELVDLAKAWFDNPVHAH